ncbi:MAG TPA: DNA polymerase/3'-5' exonuclease PolX [Nitrolancea sp.]|nr:DNA polymerase/3'-5' exonuclease PolX [Nitrolancea sp.]
MPDNRTLADQLKMFADLSEIKGENPFRLIAYRRAAETLEELDEPVEQLVREDRLTDVPGIGPGIAAALREMVETGRWQALDELQDEVPATLLTMLDVPGIGTKSVARFYHELGITDLVQLEARARQGDIRTLKGFGAKQEARILNGIAFLNQRTGRLSIGTGVPAAEALVDLLKERLGVEASIAGSVRRMCETVGNIDLVVATNEPDAIGPALEESGVVTEVAYAESTVVTGRHLSGVELRVAVVDPSEYGNALLRWTGSRAFVTAFEEQFGAEPKSATEAGVFEAHGLVPIPAELREPPDVIEQARSNKLPRLIALADIRGDLHLHSDWSDGHGTILEMATAARDRGYEYLSISDHSGGLAIAHGVTIERLREQWREIERVNEQVPELRLLRASEVEVHLDGSLDFPDEVLAELDLVVASLHSGLSRSTEELTDRIVRVMRNPHVDIIAHPTGRIIERRPGGTYDWETVFKVALETGTALEINANPARLDLRDEVARDAQQAGVLLVIDTDAHDVRSLDLMRYGIGVARRAGVEADGVLNTRPLSALLDWLRR